MAQERAPGPATIPEGQVLARRGRATLMWLVVVLLAIAIMLLALWGRFHQNATSTVNPAKSQPAGIPR